MPMFFVLVALGAVLFRGRAWLPRHALWQEFAWREALRYRRGWFRFEAQGNFHGIEVEIVRRTISTSIPWKFRGAGKLPRDRGGDRPAGIPARSVTAFRAPVRAIEAAR